MGAGQAGGDEGGHHGPGAVDVVHAPAAEPGPGLLLFGQQPLDAAPGARVVLLAEDGQHLHHVRGDVGGGRVDHLAEVAERQPVGEGAGVVGVEGAPRAVLRPHAHRPAGGPPHGRLEAVGVGVPDPFEGEDDLGGVVHVGVDVVVELEGPAARGQVGPAHGPVAGAQDLLVQQPVGGLHQRRVVGGHAGVGEGGHGQAGVPHRGLAGLDHADGGAVRAVLVPDGETVQRLQARAQHRVAEVVAEEVEGDDRVHGGGLDAAPAAVVLLTLDDPAGRGVQRGAAQRDEGEAVVGVQRLVQALEEALPAGGGGERARRVRPAGVRVQLVEVEGRGPYGAQRGDDGERHDGLPGPLAEVVDVEGDPLRQEHELGRELGEVLPPPPAEERQPDPGEDPGGGDAALLADPRGGGGHVGVLGGVAGESEGDVGLDGRGELGGAAVEGGPGAVGALPRADEAGGGLGGPLVADAEELAQHQVFGVHGDVGLQVALPPALGVLAGEEVRGGALDGAGGGLARLRGPGGGRRPGQNGCALVGLGCAGRMRPGAVGRRCHGFP